MTKVVGLDGKRPACPYCGHKPACPDFTCPRIASVWSDDDSWQIDFAENWQPPPTGDETK